MQLTLCCLVIALITTHSNGAVNVEKTVAQVQNILQQNSQLPRLTREEIIQLLNDIRSEDAKSKSSSQSEELETSTQSNKFEAENEIISVTHTPYVVEYDVPNEKSESKVENIPTEEIPDTTTKSNEPSIMVVLPYTPRDGSSLQELYTRPPRVELVSATESSLFDDKKYVKANEDKLSDHKSSKPAYVYPKQLGFTTDLQKFLDLHGLKGQADHFLLPLDGFKPIPSPKVLDGSVELPENILLTYDLISPLDKLQGDDKVVGLTNNNFLYDPIRPELPFELETSSSEKDEKSVLPLDLPRSRKVKAAPTTNYAPVDYDAVKVIPLPKGPNPASDLEELAELENELRKRQTNNTTDDSLKITLSTSFNDSTDSSTSSEVASTTESSRDASSTTTTTEAPPSSDSVSAADTDSGASIADLEDSFGGPLPSEPGDSQLPPPKKNGFYWMLDWNSFYEVGDGDTKVNIRFEPKLGDPQMFLPITVP